MEEQQLHLSNKIDVLLEKISNLDRELVNVSSNVNFLTKSLEQYQIKLDTYVHQTNNEISEINKKVAVHASQIEDLRKDNERITQLSNKATIVMLGAAATLIVSLIGNIVMFLIRKQ